MSPNRLLRPGPLPLHSLGSPPRRQLAAAIVLVLATVTASPAFAAPDYAANNDLLRRAWLDPQLRKVDSLPMTQVTRAAIDYGMQQFLPASPQSTRAVSNCDDAGVGSLRVVVAAAASGDTIDLRGLGCSTITLFSGEIVINQQSLTLLGPGPNALKISRSSNSYNKYVNRIFEHTGSGSFIVQGMTIADGSVKSSSTSPHVDGGCIKSNGTLFLGNAFFVGDRSTGVHVDHCRVTAASNDTTTGYATGGAVYATAVVLTNSTVSNSSVYGPRGMGAGVYAQRLAMNQSVLTGNSVMAPSKYGGGGAVGGYLGSQPNLVFNSTISGNAASFGGGISLKHDGEIRNSTISGNTASISGGGVGARGLGQAALTISNSTITANVCTGGSGYHGGGLAAYTGQDGPVTLQSTIIAGNFCATSTPDDIAGTAIFQGANNLVGTSIPGTPVLPVGTVFGNPQLGPLAYNGGPTRTHALLGNSPAIDLGNNALGLATDQRGDDFPRVVGAAPDIGAYEFDADRIFRDGFD